MSNGIGQVTQMDPTTKVEIWLFQKIGYGPKLPGTRGNHGVPIYKRLPYNLVSYDGDPAQYIEPVCVSEFVKVFDGPNGATAGDPIQPINDGYGRCGGVQFYDKRPFEVFSYNDVDVANNLGQLP
jgi:hypothetical protein